MAAVMTFRPLLVLLTCAALAVVVPACSTEETTEAKVGPFEPKATWPQFATVHAAPGTPKARPRWQAFFAGGK